MEVLRLGLWVWSNVGDETEVETAAASSNVNAPDSSLVREEGTQAAARCATASEGGAAEENDTRRGGGDAAGITELDTDG
mmetsp:Transcript_46959/g.54406  ORF Transcript_46959/g.54406 Transcript_46959/m.54406 type:complete len:80 (+) Transcript_46959:428-667(+)